MRDGITEMLNKTRPERPGESVLRALAIDDFRPKRPKELLKLLRGRVESSRTLYRWLAQLERQTLVQRTKLSHKRVEYRVDRERYLEMGRWDLEEPARIVHDIMELILLRLRFASREEAFRVALGFGIFFYMRHSLFPALMFEMPARCAFVKKKQRNLVPQDWIEKLVVRRHFVEMLDDFCYSHPDLARSCVKRVSKASELKVPLSTNRQFLEHMLNFGFGVFREFLGIAHVFELGYGSYDKQIHEFSRKQRTMRSAIAT